MAGRVTERSCQVPPEPRDRQARGGDLGGAISDYDAAIAFRQAIACALGAAWPVPLQNDLARSLQIRGLAKASGGDPASAIADYDGRDQPDGRGPSTRWASGLKPQLVEGQYAEHHPGKSRDGAPAD